MTQLEKKQFFTVLRCCIGFHDYVECPIAVIDEITEQVTYVKGVKCSICGKPKAVKSK